MDFCRIGKFETQFKLPDFALYYIKKFVRDENDTNQICDCQKYMYCIKDS